MDFLQGTEKSPEVPEEDQRRVTELLNQYENGGQGVFTDHEFSGFRITGCVPPHRDWAMRS
jgi:hypothetical protein